MAAGERKFTEVAAEYDIIGSGFGSKNAVRVIGLGSVWTSSGSFGVGGYGFLYKFGGGGVYLVMELVKWCWDVNGISQNAKL